jgi:hypothetical protein
VDAGTELSCSGAMLRLALAVLVLIHGAIHFFGFAKAFGIARMRQLAAPISKPAGALWMITGLAFIVAAVLLFVGARSWWVPGLFAVIASEALIVADWSDAKAGTIANLIVLLPLVLAILDLRSSSFRSIYEHDVERALAPTPRMASVTEADLASLPPQVQTHLRRAGVVGKPRVHDFHARSRGIMRFEPDAKWIDIQADQHNVVGDSKRLFFIRSAIWGVPFEGLHVYDDGKASMRIRIASVVDVADVRGPEMNQGETVTLFNDLCAFAPAGLIDADVEWVEVDAHTVSATFANDGNIISAQLVFDEAGDLADFVSVDRFKSMDGKDYENPPWSTPLSGYKDFGGVRLASQVDAIWHQEEGDFVYARFELESIEYNLAATYEAGEPLSSR